MMGWSVLPSTMPGAHSIRQVTACLSMSVPDSEPQLLSISLPAAAGSAGLPCHSRSLFLMSHLDLVLLLVPASCQWPSVGQREAGRSHGRLYQDLGMLYVLAGWVRG